MTHKVYRYSFSPDVLIEDVECALLLAIWGAEGLHGEAQTRLDASHFLNPAERTCVIDADSEVGRDVNRLFVGFLGREIDTDTFEVQRVAKLPVDAPTRAAA